MADKNHLNNLELRSEEVQEILTKVPHWMIRWGNILFLFLIIVLLTLSWFIKYPDIITSNTIVTTKIRHKKTTQELQVKLIQFLSRIIKN